MSGLSHPETGDLDYYGAGVRGIADIVSSLDLGRRDRLDHEPIAALRHKERGKRVSLITRIIDLGLRYSSSCVTGFSRFERLDHRLQIVSIEIVPSLAERDLCGPTRVSSGVSFRQPCANDEDFPPISEWKSGQAPGSKFRRPILLDRRCHSAMG